MAKLIRLRTRLLTRRLLNGKVVHYPTRDDVVDALVADGLVEDENDLVENHHKLVAYVQFYWMQHSQLGCRFGQRIAIKPEESGIYTLVVKAPVNDSAFVEEVNQTLNAAVGDFEAVQLIFPKIRTPEEIRNLVNGLCASDQWYCKRVPWDPDGQSKQLTQLLGLRWVLPDDKHVNWALGLADIATMPITRRAPYTALVIRTGGPGPIPESMGLPRPDKENGLTPVHLADLPLEMLDSSRWSDIWKRTKDLKEDVIGNDQLQFAAKAKVTFSLPTRLGINYVEG